METPLDADSHDLPKLPPSNEILLQESSSSQESCQTYFTKRMEELEAGDSTIPIPEVTVLPEKESFGGDLVLTPSTNQPSFDVIEGLLSLPSIFWTQTIPSVRFPISLVILLKQRKPR